MEEENIRETTVERSVNRAPVGRVEETGNMRREATMERSMDRARGGRIVYFILGAIEVLLAFRLVFKLLGANPTSPFVSFIYGFSGIFHAPFSGIFSRATTRGVETTAVFEPSTIIAMIVYAIVAAGIVKLLVASSRRPDQVERGL